MLFETVRKLRAENDITLREVSEATGLNVGAISRIERGLVQPNIRSAYKLKEWAMKVMLEKAEAA